MSFYRKPSPLEVTYVGTDTEDYSPFVNQFIVEGEGHLDLDRWKKAVEKASLANPGSRLILKGFWGFKYWDDQGPLPLVTKVKTDWDGSSSEGAPYLGGPINPRVGPNAQVILIDNEKPRIIFRSHHAMTDGQGMIHWMMDIFRALKDEDLVGSKGTTSEGDIIEKIDYPPRQIVEGKCIPVAKPSQKPDERYCRWVRMSWQGKYTKLVPKLMLAMSRIAWRNNGDDGKIIFRIPSDLRRYDDKEAPFSMANAIGAIDLYVTKDSTVNSLQKEILGALRTKGDVSAFPKKAYILRWLPTSLYRFRPEVIKRCHENVSYRMTGIISHLGETDLENSSYDEFKITGTYGVPIPLENRSIFVGFSINSSNGLDAVVSVPKALTTHEELIALCEEIKTELNTF
ncbi:MAG: hypothetical protein MI976_20630 [Pseudomonadales bacterium]|nr:hypothetical protein [Pseudomonadales bacterium]